MLRVGFIGWRGMVGSVLMKRMQANNDFKKIDAVFFSTSDKGGKAPEMGQKNTTLLDAYDVKALLNLDCIVTAQGGDYTDFIMPKLKDAGFSGFFVDASSALRMSEDSLLILDPINYNQIVNGIKNGTRIYCGSNCTVSLMLLAISGLLKHDLVEWVNSQTYQAASGAGANNMRELIAQCGVMYSSVGKNLEDKTTNILDIDQAVSEILGSDKLPTQYFGAPLAGNVLPWIDKAMENGQTKEEWKGMVEANKILGLVSNTLKIDGNCVRVGSLRSHSQALTIKLRDSNISVNEIEGLIKSGNEWVRFVPNNKPDTLKYLTPASVNGTLDIAVGRVRKLNLGEDYLSMFTVGDQLLWGAAEPIRRLIDILVKHA
ncbi:MAG: asd [Burkholderiales bacterium]|jgi:aspartate-semialdehyde dehydrogenase|nr:asd [Burkholderiales bacterium]